MAQVNVAGMSINGQPQCPQNPSAWRPATTMVPGAHITATVVTSTPNMAMRR